MSTCQLRYLEALVVASDIPVAVIPGPPAIRSRDLTDAKLHMVKRILREARHVWAYLPEVKNSCDGMIGRERASSAVSMFGIVRLRLPALVSDVRGRKC